MRLISLLFCCSSLLAAPGEAPRTNSLSFAWEKNDAKDGVIAYHLYYRTNELIGMTLTNAGGIHNFKPFAIDPGWMHLAETTNSFITIPNPGAKFAIFSVTASNLYGESPFSNVAWIPALLGNQERKLRISEVK